MAYRETAETIQRSLGLDSAPVALAFMAEAPAGMATASAEVPSACSFWRQAEQGVFYAAARQHFNCPVGALVMGLELPEPVMSDLMGTVGEMCKCNYITMEEVQGIPKVTERPGGGILYGPLAELPVPPDAVILWLTPAQGMVYAEAAGLVDWGAARPRTLTGRPACAAIPEALNQGAGMLSLGCMGMRTFTEVSEDRMLAVVPGAHLQSFADALTVAAEANRAMKGRYEASKARFA